MSKYLKLFDTTAAYEAAESSLILPNVSLTVDNNTVHYNPSTPTPSHDYVEIAGVKWATMNVGATGVTDYGNYYQYGKGSAQYAATSGDSKYSGTENPLAASADTATQEWGEGWRMPTSAECASLTANTNYEFVENYNGSGVNGGKFTAQNGNYVFFPAAGYYNGGSVYNVGSSGNYWSSTPYNSGNAYYLNFLSGNRGVDSDTRRYGYSVRPVMGA